MTHVIALPGTLRTQFLPILLDATGLSPSDCLDALSSSRMRVSGHTLGRILAAAGERGLQSQVRVDPPSGTYDLTHLDPSGDDGWGEVSFRMVDRPLYARLLSRATGCTLLVACEALDHEAVRLTSEQAGNLAEAFHDAGRAGEAGRVLIAARPTAALDLDGLVRTA